MSEVKNKGRPEKRSIGCVIDDMMSCGVADDKPDYRNLEKKNNLLTSNNINNRWRNITHTHCIFPNK